MPLSTIRSFSLQEKDSGAFSKSELDQNYYPLTKTIFCLWQYKVTQTIYDIILWTVVLPTICDARREFYA